VSAAPATFLFADIAGYTALTEAHGDEQAVALVDAFCRAVDAELPAGGTRIKSIGDAVMLRVPDPGDAILLGLCMTRDHVGEYGTFGVRVGLHHGTAVEREGDYFGATVNLAARVSSLAAGGEVLMTGQTAVLVPDLQGVVFESRGRHELRNVAEPVEIFAALRASDLGADDLPIDPVCQMSVDPDRAAGRLTYDGTIYYFCSLPCAGHFAGRPERFARPTRG
jgi:class 3 adenylate cyclase/YHS domain-containing protein